MTLSVGSNALFLSISAVERHTGISKETLRVWERRYGFPQPIRDNLGERVYPVEQVDRLRIIRRLVSSGFRPGKVVRQPLTQLMALSAQATAARQPSVEPVARDGVLEALRQCVIRHRFEDLRDRLRVSLVSLGLGRFVHEIIVPLTRRTLQDCALSTFRPFEERLFLETVTAVLREAIGRIPARHTPPSVLLATVPQEPMGLPLLISECLLSIEGVRCLSLGTQTPVWDIAMAAQACQSDIVLLQYSGAYNPNAVAETVRALRAKLPEEVEVWIGGLSAVLRRKPPTHSIVVEQYRDLARNVARWRNGTERGRLESLQLSVITSATQASNAAPAPGATQASRTAQASAATQSSRLP